MYCTSILVPATLGIYLQLTIILRIFLVHSAKKTSYDLEIEKRRYLIISYQQILMITDFVPGCFIDHIWKKFVTLSMSKPAQLLETCQSLSLLFFNLYHLVWVE